MNYDVLIPELVNDPLQRQYASMSHEEAAASMNAVDIAIRKLVPLWNVKKTAIETGCWLAINDQSSGAYTLLGDMASPFVVSSALTLPQIRQLALRRPNMGGLIRSRYETPIPTATTETPPAVTYRPMMMQVC